MCCESKSIAGRDMLTTRTKTVAAVVLLLSLASGSSSHAQWVRTDGPGGGTIQCFAVSPVPGGTNLFAGTYSGEVFLSTNNGTSWTAVNSGLTNSFVYCLAVSPASGGTESTDLFAGTNGGVFLSTNNGKSWKPVNAGMTSATVYALTVSPASGAGTGSTSVFAGTAGGVFLSTDNGTTWSPVNAGMTNSYVTSLAASGGKLLAGTYGGGVFLSTNSGEAWTAVNSGLTGRYVNTFAVSPVPGGTNLFAGTSTGGVSLSTDGGNSWTAVNSGLTDLDVRSLAVSGTNLFAGTGAKGGVFLSTNNGVTWTAVDSGLTNSYVLTLAASPGSGGSTTSLFAGTEGGGVFLSTNNGETWRGVNTGLTDSGVRSLAVNGTGLFAGIAATGGVFLSTNNGTNWGAVNSGLANSFIYSVAASGTNLFAGTDGGVYLSTDNGTGWTAVNTGLASSGVYSIAASPASGAGTGGVNLFAGAEGGGVFLSTNNGTNWSAVNSGLTTSQITCFAVSPASGAGTGGTNLFAGTYSGEVFLSSNNGTSWAAVNTGLTGSTIYSLAVSPASGVWDAAGSWTGGTNLFAGAEGGGVSLSTNNGTNWKAVNSGLSGTFVYSLAVSPASGAYGTGGTGTGGTNLFAGTDRGVFLSTDNGTTWKAFSTGIPDTYVLSLAVNGTNLFAGTGLFGVWRRPLSDVLPNLVASITASQVGSNRVELFWKTNSETNCYGFEIQKTKLPPDYTSIPNAFISGQGTTLSPHAYSWVDSSAQFGDYYRLKQTDLDGVAHYTAGIQAGNITDLAGVTGRPGQFRLEQNYPNPFNPSTTIHYTLPAALQVTLTVFNTLGQQVAAPVDEFQGAGSHEAHFGGEGLASGVYFYRLKAGDLVATKRLILLR
jgi:hypothetical protein